MSKLWEQVTENIDERFTNEAAEYFAKHSSVEFVQDKATSYEAHPIALKSDSSEKKQSKGRIIAVVCAAAAAVGICILGGIHLMKNANPLLPADTSTSEASETHETLETSEITYIEYSDISSVETTLTLVDMINKDEIIAQAGFDIPIDMEEYGDEYQASIDYVDAMPDGPDKERYIKQNYLIASSFKSCYVGSNTADWICTISYDFCHSDGFTVSFYSKVFYVKNGHITETVFEADRAGGLKREGRYIYIENGDDGLFMLDTDTMVEQTITTDAAEYFYSNDECAVFRNTESGRLYVYIHESGEVIATDIVYGVGYGNTHTFLGDRIRYHDEEADKIYELMLPSCEKHLVDVEYKDAFPPRGIYANEFYDINVSEDRKSIVINDLQSESTDELYITELVGEYGYGGYISSGNRMYLYEHTLYIPISKNNYDVAVYVKYDIPTKRAVYADFSGIYDTRMDGEHLIGVLREADEVTGNSSYSYGKVVFAPVSVDEPKIDPVEAELMLMDMISKDDIIAQAGYDVPINMEEFGEDYQAAVEYVNSLTDEARKQRHIEQNYFTASMYDICYVGSSEADWICAINYDLCYVDGISTSFYSRVFYVKNGLITENVFVADRESSVVRADDHVYISKGTDGLFMLNVDTMVIQAITTDSAYHIQSNDEYVLFRNRNSNTLQVYVRESGEIISTDIYMGQYDGTMNDFMGDRIRYYDDKTEDVYDFMLPSGEIQTPEVGLSYFYAHGDNFDNEYYDIYVDNGLVYPDQCIAITHKATGKVEKLYLRELPSNIYHRTANSLAYMKLYDHTLYIPFTTENNADGIYVVYDIRTGKARHFVNDDDINILTAYGDDVIGMRSGPEEPDKWPDEYYFRIGLLSVSPEAQTDGWASVDLYRGTDIEAVLFANALSDEVKEKNQAVYDDYVNELGEDGLTDEYLMMIDMMQYGVTAYYVEANDGAEFWLKRYMRKGGQFFDFTEIYLRKDGEFRYIETVDWLDVQYHGDTMVRCSGDYLYYSHDDGIVERISTNGEKEHVFDMKQYAMEDLFEPLETISLSAEGTTMRGSGDVLELTYRYAHNSRELRESRVTIDTDNKVLKQEHGAVGISIVDGEGIPFEVTTRKHQHDPKQMLAEDLMYLGREKLSDAIKLYQIKTGEGVSSDLESYEDIKTLFDSTFAGDMYNYADHYYASGEPVSAPWYDDNDRLKESLWSSIDGKVDHNGKLVHNGYDISDECWTILCGVLDNGVDFVEYDLCTILKNTTYSIDSDIPYYYEHSVMRLEKIGGEWKITQLRTRLGNEYGTEQRDKLIELGYDELQDVDFSYTEIMRRLLESDGHEVIGTSVEDFDFDGVDELAIMTEKNGSRALRFYEQQSYGWEFVELEDEQYISWPNAAQFIRYDDGNEQYYYSSSGYGMVKLSFHANDNEYDINGGSWGLAGYPLQYYNTPIEYPGVLHALYERYPDSEPNYYEFADTLVYKWIAALTDKSTYSERMFNIINWDVQDIKVMPIDKAPSYYNVTEEELALENAWIVDPDVWYTYEGKVNGRRGDANNWYESIGAENIGFLMWQEGDTFFMRSRWLNCGTKELMTDDELKQFLDESLQPAISCAELIYFCGNDAKTAGMPQIAEGLYEVAPDFPYSSIEILKEVAAEYYTEEGVELLDIDGWFTVVDGKLCAHIFNKGLSCSGYSAENAEVLSQYSFHTYDKVVIKLKMTDWLTKDQYSGDGYGALTLVYDYVKGKWLFEKPVI